ncbi:MAG: hypothetical protein D6820_03520 [Lentisphaerae bacterium]|nr:MAG: hypothetical protein D6820_03520 [Lentisphaerota bacterium]
MANALIPWLKDEDAQKIVEVFPSIRGYLKGDREDPLYQALIVHMAYRYWRKMGWDPAFVKKAWYAFIDPNLTSLSSQREINELGLLGGNSPWGVPQQEGGGALTPSMTAYLAFKMGAQFAKAVLEYQEKASEWEKIAGKLKAKINLQLTAPATGLKVDSPQLFPAVSHIPEQRGIQGTIGPFAWLYGLTLMKTPILYHQNIRRFDAPSLMAFLPFYMNYHGVRLDNTFSKNLKHTLIFLRESLPLKNTAFQQHNLVTYRDSVEHLYMCYASLCADQVKVSGELLNALIHYTYDEFAPIAEKADNALSPYLIPGCFNIAPDGRNLGATGDEGGARKVALFLELVRLMIGLDDHDPDVLYFYPRIPRSWTGLKLTNWPISHRFDHGRTSKIELDYQRTLKGENINLRSNKTLQKIVIRLGPYPMNTRMLRASVNGENQTLRTFVQTGMRWATLSARRVLNLRVTTSSSQ